MKNQVRLSLNTAILTCRQFLNLHMFLILVLCILHPINGFAESRPIDFTTQGQSFSLTFILYNHNNNHKTSISYKEFKEWEHDITHNIEQKKYTEALKCSQKMERAAIIANSDYWLTLSYYYSGISTRFLNDYKTSLNYFLKIHQYKPVPFQEENDRIFKLFRYTGDVYKKLKAYPEAICYYKKCFELKNKLVDKKELISPYISMGFIYSSQHDFQNAKEYYVNGLNLAKGYDDRAASTIYNNLGNDEYSQGNFSNAIEYYIHSIELSEKIKDWEGLTYSYNNLGNIYIHDLKDLNKALEYYTKSLELEKKSGNNNGVATELNNIGNVYSSQLKFDDAEKCFMEALHIFRTNKNNDGVATALENLGTLYSKAGNFKKAIDAFDKCIYTRKKNKDEINLDNVYDGVGTLYYNHHEYQKALYFYTKALEFAELKKDKSLIKRSYFGIHQTYAKLRQFDKAYTYLLKYSNIKDTILNETISKQIIDIQEKYEKNKMQQQVAMQTLEIRNKLLQRNGILAFLILTILIFSSIVYIIFQRRRNERLLYDRNSKIKDQEIKNLIQDSEIRSMVSMAEGQEQERQRISRELHDRVGSMLSLIKLNLSNAGADNKQIKENLNLLDNTYQEVRNISHNLHSGLLNHFGLKAALNDLRNMVESHSIMRVNLFYYENEANLPKETESVIFKVLQELVTNALKYSEAKNLDIQINEAEDGIISIAVEDDGKGFDTSLMQNKGIGLKNVRYRIESVGGSVEINSAPGKGVCIMLNVPVPAMTENKVIS